jgi:TonB family protein
MKSQMFHLVVAAFTLFASAASAKETPAASVKDTPTASVKGSLDKELIRNVIRSHIKEVKTCYESELEHKKDLAGKVMIRFTISPAGKVSESAVEQTTLGNATVEKCIAEAVRGWEFPKPQGGSVVVSYPFVLATDGPPAK